MRSTGQLRSQLGHRVRIRSRRIVVDRCFNHFSAPGTKALLEIKVVPRESVFEQEGPCLDPRRRMISRLDLIENLSTTTTEMGRLLFHS